MAHQGDTAFIGGGSGVGRGVAGTHGILGRAPMGAIDNYSQ
jgi:hypothetical protein